MADTDFSSLLKMQDVPDDVYGIPPRTQPDIVVLLHNIQQIIFTMSYLF